MTPVVVDVLSWGDAAREASRVAGAAEHIEQHSRYLQMADQMGLAGRGAQYQRDVDDVIAELDYIQARVDSIRSLAEKTKEKL